MDRKITEKELDRFMKLAGLVNEDWHPDDPSAADIDDTEEDPEDFDDVSEEELNEADGFKFKKGDVVRSKAGEHGSELIVLRAFPNLRAANEYNDDDKPTTWEQAIINGELGSVSEDVANKPWYLTWTREVKGENLVMCEPEEFLSK